MRPATKQDSESTLGVSAPPRQTASATPIAEPESFDDRQRHSGDRNCRWRRTGMQPGPPGPCRAFARTEIQRQLSCSKEFHEQLLELRSRMSPRPSPSILGGLGAESLPELPIIQEPLDRAVQAV